MNILELIDELETYPPHAKLRTVNGHGARRRWIAFQLTVLEEYEHSEGDIFFTVREDQPGDLCTVASFLKVLKTHVDRLAPSIARESIVWVGTRCTQYRITGTHILSGQVTMRSRVLKPRSGLRSKNNPILVGDDEDPRWKPIHDERDLVHVVAEASDDILTPSAMHPTFRENKLVNRDLSKIPDPVTDEWVITMNTLDKADPLEAYILNIIKDHSGATDEQLAEAITKSLFAAPGDKPEYPAKVVDMLISIAGTDEAALQMAQYPRSFAMTTLRDILPLIHPMDLAGWGTVDA